MDASEKRAIREWARQEITRYRVMERPEESVTCSYDDRLPTKSVRSQMLALLDELERVEGERDQLRAGWHSAIRMAYMDEHRCADDDSECIADAQEFVARVEELRAAVAVGEEPPDHVFLPVRGHPDDDECTHRSDGTDETYCGLPESAHEAVGEEPKPAAP